MDYKDLRKIDAENQDYIIGDKLDYCICNLRPISNIGTAGDPALLGDLTRCPLPLSGNVILVGHPEGFAKRFEVCPIIPHHIRDQVVRGRAQEAESHCHSNPTQCRWYMNNLFKPCVHAYGEETRQKILSRRIIYDTSFYEGSSGSAVLNEYGHTIAMHLGGHSYRKGLEKESLVEYALPISTIFDDVKSKKGVEKAKDLFPHC